MEGIRKLKAEGPYKSRSVSENYKLPVSLPNSIFPDKEESHKIPQKAAYEKSKNNVRNYPFPPFLTLFLAGRQKKVNNEEQPKKHC